MQKDSWQNFIVVRDLKKQKQNNTLGFLNLRQGIYLKQKNKNPAVNTTWIGKDSMPPHQNQEQGKDIHSHHFYSTLY